MQPSAHTNRLPQRRRTASTVAARLLTAALITGLVAIPHSGATTAASAWPVASAQSADLASLGWVWPAERFRIERKYIAPAHAYGPGHRGIDLDLRGGVDVRSPADGVVAFVGAVAGRGVLTIDHGGGLVTTLEPVVGELVPGTRVQRGEAVATLALGGHAAAGRLHFGVRLNGDYINPLLLLGGVPRAVLLPCCN